MRKVTRGLLMVLLVMALGPGSVLAAVYEIVAGEGTLVTFTSKAPMEKFEGKTGQITGRMEADLAHLSGDVDLEVIVDLASFDTGLAKRNRHMRENHLETDRYPEARFTAGTLSGSTGSLTPHGETEITLTGKLDLHGVIRPLTCPVRVRDLGEGRMQVETKFPVKLSDHAIKRPKFLVMKLADEQQVAVRLLLREVK